ncbi:hypothetical protein ACOYR1_00870 [Thalassotalea piscium]
MKNLASLALTAAIIILPTSQSFAVNTPSTKGQLTLSYSDGRPDSNGLKDVNAALMTVGVRVSTLPLPKAATPLIETSEKRALTKDEGAKLMSLFSLHRGQLLEQIEKAGRKPEAHRGGFLSTSEVGVAPYPKVYDMKAMTLDVVEYLQEKFGKLHVNSAENGMGIDEVMTIVSGGHWTWFFTLPDNVTGKLTLGHVDVGGKAWRISYPGLVPHGGFLEPDYGLVVAYAHGPKNFVMRYEDPGVKGSEVLGSNPWIDLSGIKPKLLK